MDKNSEKDHILVNTIQNHYNIAIYADDTTLCSKCDHASDLESTRTRINQLINN